MIYTIMGAILGGTFSFVLGRLFQVSEHSNYAPSSMNIIILLGILIGGGIGFGYGSSLFLNGTHIFQKLL